MKPGADNAVYNLQRRIERYKKSIAAARASVMYYTMRAEMYERLVEQAVREQEKV